MTVLHLVVALVAIVAALMPAAVLEFWLRVDRCRVAGNVHNAEGRAENGRRGAGVTSPPASNGKDHAQ